MDQIIELGPIIVNRINKELIQEDSSVSPHKIIDKYDEK